MTSELIGVLVVWVPIVFALVVIVVGVLMLTVVLPPARVQLREAKLRREIERRAAAMNGDELGEPGDDRDDDAPDGGTVESGSNR